MGQSGFAGPIMQAAGAIVSAVGSVSGAYYQAAVLRNNAMIAKNNARIKIAEGQNAEVVQRLKTGTLIGAQKATFAGGNIDVASGSVADVVGNTAMLGELDALTLRYNAESEALDLKNQAAALSSQANQTITAGWFDAASTILGGGAGVADKWMQYKEAGGGFENGSGSAWASAVLGG